MEIVLNLAWVVCSCGLIGYWFRQRRANPQPIRTQLLALASVVLLLLPVISLSDDLMAMQGPLETDASMRRVLQPGHDHPTVTPHFFAIPEAIASVVPAGGSTQDILLAFTPAPTLNFHTRTLGSRPPPQA